MCVNLTCKENKVIDPGFVVVFFGHITVNKGPQKCYCLIFHGENVSITVSLFYRHRLVNVIDLPMVNNVSTLQR